MSDEDLAWSHPGESADSVAQRWLDLGGTLVDTVGAGDAFRSTR